MTLVTDLKRKHNYLHKYLIKKEFKTLSNELVKPIGTTLKYDELDSGFFELSITINVNFSESDFQKLTPVDIEKIRNRMCDLSKNYFNLYRKNPLKAIIRFLLQPSKKIIINEKNNVLLLKKKHGTYSYGNIIFNHRVIKNRMMKPFEVAQLYASLNMCEHIVVKLPYGNTKVYQKDSIMLDKYRFNGQLTFNCITGKVEAVIPV